MNYKDHLSKDKKLISLLKENSFELTHKNNIPLRLMASIISQQLSTKVADVIYARFIGLFNGKEPKPHQVLETSIDTLRSVGLSNQKAGYIQNVANFFVEQKLTDAKLHKMDNEKVIQTLTQIKGEDKCTTEMLLMFNLGRQDVFPAVDLGIQQGLETL